MLDDLGAYLGGQELGLVWPILLAFLTLDAMVFVGIVMPGDAVLLAAGATAEGPFEVLALSAAGVLGCFLGASGGHFIGHRYGARLRNGRLGRRIGETRWRRAQTMVERSGPALALAYFVPVVHTLTPVLAGTLGMPYRRFLPWAMAGSVAWVASYLTIGAAAGEVLRRNAGPVLTGAAVAVVIVAVLASSARRMLTRRRSSAQDEPEDDADGNRTGDSGDGPAATFTLTGSDGTPGPNSASRPPR